LPYYLFPLILRWLTMCHIEDDTKINNVCQALELPVIPPAESSFWRSILLL